MIRKFEKIAGFNFVRTFAVYFVFLAHIINAQSDNQFVLLFIRSVSPGLTMSVLGFISGYLLVAKYESFDGAFYVKRFSRIYSSLFLCLSAVTILHLNMSYDVVNQHSIIHFMGLSFFMELFGVVNNSSLGGGLWFVTVIIILYLLLPLITTLYRHRMAFYHLLLVVFSCIILNTIMYGTASSWNIIIAFNIGCYIGINKDIDAFTEKTTLFYLFTTLVLLMTCVLSTSKIISYEFRTLLLPLYPLFAVPLLLKIGNNIKGYLKNIIDWLSGISYEVYILHFYFINKKFTDLFPSIESIFLQILIAFIIVLPIAFFISRLGNSISAIIGNYLLNNPEKITDEVSLKK